jgi:Tetratricopeptide repeat
MKRLTYFTVGLALLLSLTPVTKAQGTSYDALVQQGNSQLQSGNNEQALASAKTAINTNANRWEAYAIAGGALLNLKRYEEAADQFSHAIDHAPQAKQEGLRALRKECLSAQPAGPQSGAQPPQVTPPNSTPQAVAQQSAPPPSGPTDSGPSLAVTMQFIQDKLNDVGKVNCTVYYQSADGRTSDTQKDMCNETTNVAANPDQCKLSFGGSDPGVSLRGVQNVALMSMMQYMSKYVPVSLMHFIPGGGQIELHPVSVTPNITALVLQGAQQKELLTVDFTDAGMADRVAKAMTHAVELCGGGNGGKKDPF